MVKGMRAYAAGLLLAITTVALSACGTGGKSEQSSSNGSMTTATTETTGSNQAGEKSGASGGDSLRLPEPVKVKATVTLFDSLTYMLPVQVALEKGFWKELNLEVDVLSAVGGGDTIRGVASGATEFAIGGPEAAIKAVVAGENVKIVAPHFNGTLFAWIVPASSPVRTITDLVGKKVGYSNPGATSQSLAIGSFRAAGIDPSKVQMVAAGAMGDNWAAVKSGALDAGWATEPFVSMKVKEEGARIAFYPGDYLKDLMMDVVVANADLIRNKPEVVRAFIAGHVKGFEFVRTNPQEAAKIGEKYMHVPADVILAGLGRLKNPEKVLTDKVNPAAFKWYEEQMLKNGVLKEPVRWEEIFDQQFLPEELRAPIPNG